MICMSAHLRSSDTQTMILPTLKKKCCSDLGLTGLIPPYSSRSPATPTLPDQGPLSTLPYLAHHSSWVTSAPHLPGPVRVSSVYTYCIGDLSQIRASNSIYVLPTPNLLSRLDFSPDGLI